MLSYLRLTTLAGASVALSGIFAVGCSSEAAPAPSSSTGTAKFSVPASARTQSELGVESWSFERLPGKLRARGTTKDGVAIEVNGTWRSSPDEFVSVGRISVGDEQADVNVSVQRVNEEQASFEITKSVSSTERIHRVSELFAADVASEAAKSAPSSGSLTGQSISGIRPLDQPPRLTCPSGDSCNKSAMYCAGTFAKVVDGCQPATGVIENLKKIGENIIQKLTGADDEIDPITDCTTDIQEFIPCDKLDEECNPGEMAQCEDRVNQQCNAGCENAWLKECLPFGSDGIAGSADDDPNCLSVDERTAKYQECKKSCQEENGLK